MPIEFHCPHCSGMLRTQDNKAGMRAKCPKCGNVVTVPTPEQDIVPITEEKPDYSFLPDDDHEDFYEDPPAERREEPPGEARTRRRQQRPNQDSGSGQTGFDKIWGGANSFQGRAHRSDVPNESDDFVADDEEWEVVEERPARSRSGTQYCPTCGDPNPAGASRCMGCGEVLRRQAPRSPARAPQQRCPMCGQSNPARASRCQGCGEILQAEYEPAPRRPVRRRQYRMEYAGFWERFAAAFIDGILIGIVNNIIGFIFGFIWGLLFFQPGRPPQASDLLPVQIIAGGIGFLIQWLYCAIMESSSHQATLGKMALHLKVTDVDGNPITFGRASGRYFGKFISAVICLAGYIMAAFTERKQALHDMMSDYLVVKD